MSELKGVRFPKRINLIFENFSKNGSHFGFFHRMSIVRGDTKIITLYGFIMIIY